MSNINLVIEKKSIASEENVFGPKQLLIAKDSKQCSFILHAGSTIYIFGGDVFPEERFIDWNFVSSDKEILRKARHDWRDQKFPTVPEDDKEYIPHPNYSK